MRMTADYNIDPLFHQKGSPLLLIFGRHGFIFFSPVSDKNKAVAVFLCFLDHRSNFTFFKNINHIIFSVYIISVVSSVGVVKKSNFNPVYLQCFYSICIFLTGMDTQYRNFRIVGLPEIQSLFYVVRTIVINVIGG